MIIHEESIVGKKGEIIPKKSIRDIMNLKPGDSVIIEANPTEMVIKKVLSVEELLNLPRIGKGTPEEHKNLMWKEREFQEKISD